MGNPNEPTEHIPPEDPDDEKPFPLTTEWFELQRQEAAENARKRKAEQHFNENVAHFAQSFAADPGAAGAVAVQTVLDAEENDGTRGEGRREGSTQARTKRPGQL